MPIKPGGKSPGIPMPSGCPCEARICTLPDSGKTAEEPRRLKAFRLSGLRRPGYRTAGAADAYRVRT